MDAPVLGAEANPYYDAGQWVAGVSWRYQKSFRHFVGSEEQHERNDEFSEVINHVHLADISVRYQASKRTWLTLSVPYFIGERSNPIRAQGVVIDRAETHASGLSDISFLARRWMLDPETHSRGNFALGLGIKLPTGQSSVQDTRKTITNGVTSYTVQTVDQSIQPGDGGFGFILDLQGFQRLGKSPLAAYFSAAYLFNPRGTNGVQTYRNRPSEAVMSVADQYVARAGVSTSVPWVKNLGFSLGARLEGVPSHDALGPSEGFRRPGYVWSIDPGVSYQTARGSIGFAIPFALYRNRTRSFSDELVGGHGDAAFADYIIFLGYTHRF